MMTRTPLVLMLCLVLGLAGCVSYTAKPAPIPRLDAMPGFGTEGPLALGIDPYFEIERQKAVFDENLSTNASLPSMWSPKIGAQAASPSAAAT